MSFARSGVAMAAGLATHAPLMAATLGRASDGDWSLGRVLGALLICIVAAVGGGLVLRMRLGGLGGIARPRATRKLEVIERLALSRSAQLCLVRVGEVETLLAVLPDRISALDIGLARPAREG